MKKRPRILPALLGLAALCLLLAAAPAPAGALSEQARQRLAAANPEFAAAEANLDRMWEKLAAALPRPALEPFLENMLAWRNQGRDQTVRELFERFLRDPHLLPNSLLDAQGLPSLPAAYARATHERAKLMDMLAAQLRDESLLQAIPGWIDRVVGERGQPDAYYTFTPYGWLTPLSLGRELDLAALPKDLRERLLALPGADYDTAVILKGRINDSLSGFDLKAGLQLEPLQNVWLEWDSWAAAPPDAATEDPEEE